MNRFFMYVQYVCFKIIDDLSKPSLWFWITGLLLIIGAFYHWKYAYLLWFVMLFVFMWYDSRTGEYIHWHRERVKEKIKDKDLKGEL